MTQSRVVAEEVERSRLPISKVEWVGFADGLDLKLERKSKGKYDSRFLAQTTERMGRNAAERTDLEGSGKQEFDLGYLLALKYLLGIHVEMSSKI